MGRLYHPETCKTMRCATCGETKDWGHPTFPSSTYAHCLDCRLKEVELTLRSLLTYQLWGFRIAVLGVFSPFLRMREEARRETWVQEQLQEYLKAVCMMEAS